MSKHTYSFIVPCYKEHKEDFINCLDHIKHQTLQPYEVIVINDCGDKRLESIVKSYGFKYIYNKENLNNGGARNVGIREATGDYLVFCNSDDFFLINSLEEIDKVNKGQDLILLGLRSWYRQGEGTKPFTFEVIPNEKNTPNFSNIMCYGEPMHIVNRQFILDNDLFEIEHLTICDVDWTLRLEQCIKTYTYVPKALYFWQVGHKVIR